MDDFLFLAEKRRSIRKYSSQPVPMESLLDMIKAGTYAPSSGDLQPWRFVVITDKNIIKQVAEECPQQGWCINAPVLIVVACHIRKVTDYFGETGRKWAEQSCAAAIQNMLLMAEERGLGACWIGSFEEDNLKETLKFTEGFTIEAIIAVGLPDETPVEKQIQPLDAIVYFNEFGEATTDKQLLLRNYGDIIHKKRQEMQEKLQEQAEQIREGVKPAIAGMKDSVQEGASKIKNLFKKE